MATTPVAPPIVSSPFGQNFGPTTPIPPIYLGGQQLAVAAAAFNSIFIQPVNSITFWFNIVGFNVADILGLRFNNDSGNNYWSRHVTVAQGATLNTNTEVASTSLIRCGLAGTVNTQIFGTIGNPSAAAVDSKVVQMRVAVATGTAATAGTSFVGSAGEWVNTAAQINRIDVLTVSGNNFLPGSSIMIWGGI